MSETALTFQFILTIHLTLTQSDNVIVLSCESESSLLCHTTKVFAEEIDENAKIVISEQSDLKASEVIELHLSWIRHGIRRPLREFENLKTLGISHSSLGTLRVDLLRNLNQLETLRLDKSGIKKLPEFPNLRKLKKIFLAGNDIEMIRKRTFVNLPALTLLTMEQNEIFYIHPEAFAQNKNLKELNLNRNDLRTLELNTFSNNVNLSEIALNYNNLGQLPTRIFKKNLNLETLRLHGNKLQSLSKDVFKHNSALKWIELGDNRLQFIHSTVFKDLKNLQFVDVTRNDCIDDSFPTEMTFQHLLHLTERNCHHLAALYYDFL